MANIVAVNPFRPQWPRLRAAASAIRRGEVLAIPTDTFYGLAADPLQPKAVERIFRIKKRPETKPILLLIASTGQLRGLVRGVPPLFHTLAARFWPGPLTMVLPAADGVPDAVTAGTGAVAVRLPAAAVPRALAREVGRPLTGTSANLSGHRAARTAREAASQLGGSVYYILDGGRARSREASTILDLTGPPRIVRSGAIPASDLDPYLR